MNEHVYTFALQKLVGAPRSLWAVRRNPHMQGLPLLHELGPRPTLSPPLEPRAKDGARRKCPHSPHPTVASSGPETRRRASLRRRCRTVPATFHTPPSWRSTTRRADGRRNLSSKSLLDFPRRCRREVRTCSPNRSELLLDQTRAPDDCAASFKDIHSAEVLPEPQRNGRQYQAAFSAAAKFCALVSLLIRFVRRHL